MADSSTVIAFCPLPPPVTGQRIASETFIGLMRDHVHVVHVPPASRPPRTVAGGFDAAYLQRTWGGLRRLRGVLRAAPGATLYFCPSSSLLGLARDAATVAAARGRAGRIVAHIHLGDYEQQFVGPRAPLARWLARRIDAYCVPTETQARALRPAAVQTPVFSVTNVVDPVLRFDAAQLDAALASRLRRPGLDVLYLSNFARSKGYLDLLNALAHTANDVRVTFVGTWLDASDRDEFMDVRTRLGVQARAVVLEPVATRAAVRERLLAADVVCLPTRYDAQPLVVLEGLTAGCPVVSTAQGSLPEYVIDGETGIVVPPSDPEAIARALTRLTDPKLRERLGRQAWALARDRFAPSRALGPLLQALGIESPPAAGKRATISEESIE